MWVEQYVMAYEAEQDRLRAILPDGYQSLRPVLRINGEIRTDGTETVYLEFNTAVEAGGKRGWLNIGNWSSRDGLVYKREGRTVRFSLPFLEITFQGTGIAGGCPAETDNDGCFLAGRPAILRLPEKISSSREFCDCRFAWKFTAGDAQGESEGKTMKAFFTEVKTIYDRQEFTPENAAAIPCRQVLGAYVVKFERTSSGQEITAWQAGCSGIPR